MRKIKIKEAIIVEGIYDKIKLDSIFDAIIININGFAIYNDKKKLELIKTLAKKCGVIILTDSDFSGFRLRNYLSGCINEGTVKHAYVPEILGKEKRKLKRGKEGLLGVEGMEVDTIKVAMEKARYNKIGNNLQKKLISKADLFEDGLTGKQNSAIIRCKLLEHLGMPSKISTNSLLKVLNNNVGYEHYKTIIKEVMVSNDERCF